MGCLGYVDPDVYFITHVVGAVAGIAALAVIAAGIYEGGKAIENQLTHINDNLTGIGKSLRKLAEGGLEKDVKQSPEH